VRTWARVPCPCRSALGPKVGDVIAQRSGAGVVTVGSASKVFCGGLQVGWLRLGEARRSLSRSLHGISSRN
jgi:DNA-binding transcriptional MocR family regulator